MSEPRSGDVDELAVAAASARLDQLAASSPGLLGDPSAANIEEWIEIIETDEKGPHMPKSTEPGEQLAFRFPKKLVERIDRYAVTLAEEHSGIEFSRSQVVRVLLTRALDALDKEKSPKRRSGKAGS